MSKLQLDDVAEFSWDYGNTFFLETSKGNFIWSDPSYPGGDNTIRQFNGSLDDFLTQTGVPFVRDKGTHTIRGYCGEDVKII